jgi:hypothetical protein
MKCLHWFFAIAATLIAVAGCSEGMNGSRSTTGSNQHVVNRPVDEGTTSTTNSGTAGTGTTTSGTTGSSTTSSTTDRAPGAGTSTSGVNNANPSAPSLPSGSSTNQGTATPGNGTGTR